MRTFTSSAVLFILAASVASLTDGRLTRQRHGRRGRHDHNDIAQRMAGDVVLRSFLNSRFTWFETGLGACGKTNVGSDLIVAMNTQQFEKGKRCFEQVLITIGGKSAVAQIVDECPGCPFGGLDFSSGLFKHFADQSVGVLQGSWSFVGAGAGTHASDDARSGANEGVGIGGTVGAGAVIGAGTGGHNGGGKAPSKGTSSISIPTPAPSLTKIAVPKPSPSPSIPTSANDVDTPLDLKNLHATRPHDQHQSQHGYDAEHHAVVSVLNLPSLNADVGGDDGLDVELECEDEDGEPDAGDNDRESEDDDGADINTSAGGSGSDVVV